MNNTTLPEESLLELLAPLNHLFQCKGVPSLIPKEDLDLYKLSGTSRVYYKIKAGMYDSAKLSDLSALLSIAGVELPSEPESKYPLLEEYKEKVLSENVVHFAGALAGCKPGLVETDDGRKILVTEDSGWTEPAQGDWSTLKGFLEALFGSALVVLFAWLKIALEDLRACREHGPWKANLRQSQAVIIVGPPNCGKTLWATLLRRMLGGKVADPYPYFCGETRFNEELPAAPLLLMDDVTESISPRNRVRLTQSLKSILVSGSYRVEAKGQRPLQLKSCQRIVMLANEDSAETLPLFMDSFRDKVMLFEAGNNKQFPAWKDQLEKDCWVNSLMKCLPAFCHFLLHEYAIPPEHQNPRFGVAAYHDERLLPLLDCGDDLEFVGSMFKFAVLQNQARPNLQDLDSVLKASWEGQSRQLYSLLVNHCNAKLVDRFTPTAQRIGLSLASLEQLDPESFIRGRLTKGNTKWKVKVEMTHEEVEELKRMFIGA